MRMLEINPQHVIAFGDKGPRSIADLHRDAWAIAASLPPADEGSSPESEVLIVSKQDRYLFAAALLACWYRGHKVALPPNTRKETLIELSQKPSIITTLHDTASGEGLGLDNLLSRASPPIEHPSLADFLNQSNKITVYTSGSSGPSRAFEKSFAQLFYEAKLLAQHFAISPQDRIVATVLPGHIYGLLFSVLIPFASGAAFLRESALHASALAHRIQRYEATILATVPAHIRSFRTVEPHSLATLQRVFSSTAPLAAPDAQAFADRHQKDITEIFGSTETGGIASRQQGQSTYWRALPEVEISADAHQHLVVRSPFIGSSHPYRTQDLIEIQPDGSFAHQGRADGIVKIGGQRVSLPEMEAWIRKLPAVEDAAVLAVQDESGRGHKILAAIVGQSDELTLRETLAKRFEPSTIPRKFHFQDQIPREDNGKLRRDQLLFLLGRSPTGRPLTWKLRWHPAEREAEGLTSYRIDVPPELGWFPHHFPNYPILPAAVQLRDIAAKAIRELSGCELIPRWTKLKFVRRIKPGDQLQALFHYLPGEERVRFEIKSSQGVVTSGLAWLNFDAASTTPLPAPSPAPSSTPSPAPSKAG